MRKDSEVGQSKRLCPLAVEEKSFSNGVDTKG